MFPHCYRNSPNFIPHTLHCLASFLRWWCLLFFLTPALAGSTANASTVAYDAQGERDNLHIEYGRNELSWLSDAIGPGLLRLAVHSSYAGADLMQGIPGGWRVIGGLDIGWIQGVGPVELRVGAGFDDLPKANSWRTSGQLRYAPAFLPGASARIGVVSGLMDGWYTYGIRSSAGTGALSYTNESNWMEAGAVIDERTGATDPGAPLALDLRDNRLTTLYAWASHAWTSWLLAGVSGKWSDSQLDFRQPTQEVDTRIDYIDYPYPTPHRETALGALLELHIAQVKIKANWPVYSVGSYRAELQALDAGEYFYSAHGMTVADVRASVSPFAISNWKIGLQIYALSRPYAPYKWFTSEAWNQVGFSVTVQYEIRHNDTPEHQDPM